MSHVRVQNLSISLDGFAAGEDPGTEAPLGRGTFGPQVGPWRDTGTDDEWRGWWGERPPFGTPVYVLTHHPRPSPVMDGGTVFPFVDAGPQEVLALARDAADGLDVRLGAGATTAGVPGGGPGGPAARGAGAGGARARCAAVGRPRGVRGAVRARAGGVAERGRAPDLHAAGMSPAAARARERSGGRGLASSAPAGARLVRMTAVRVPNAPGRASDPGRDPEPHPDPGRGARHPGGRPGSGGLPRRV